MLLGQTAGPLGLIPRTKSPYTAFIDVHESSATFSEHGNSHQLWIKVHDAEALVDLFVARNGQPAKQEPAATLGRGDVQGD